MGDSRDLLNLAPGSESDGDPVEGNPFRKEDPRHEVWKEATRDAAGKLHLLHSNLIKSFPRAPEDHNSWRVNLAAAKFDIWAERNVSVVWSDDAVLDYDKWLASYANAWMKLFEERFSALIDLDSLLHELGVRLVERMEFWRGIARAFVTEMRSASLPGTRSESEVRAADEVGRPEVTESDGIPFEQGATKPEPIASPTTIAHSATPAPSGQGDTVGGPPKTEDASPTQTQVTLEDGEVTPRQAGDPARLAANSLREFVEGAMSTSNSSWQDLIPPEDPRYETWLLMRALIQGEHNAATEEFLSAYQNGSLQLADFLTFIERCFDGAVEPIVMAVTGTVFAERLARNLEQFLEKVLDNSKKWFPVIESSTGLDADSLETKIRLRLTARVAAWNKKAFRIALDEEIARSRELPESAPAAQPASRGAEDAAPAQAARNQRLTGTITSQIAARRMLAHWKSKGIGQTEFAVKVGTSDRTLRKFRQTGKIRRDIFDAIASVMGTTREALMKPE